MIRHPLMFSRRPDLFHTHERPAATYIVVLPTAIDETYIETSWQDNDIFPTGEIYHPTIDTVDPKDIYIFDSEDEEENHRQALLKMKELWAQVVIPPKRDV